MTFPKILWYGTRKTNGNPLRFEHPMQPYAALSLLHSRPGHDQQVASERPAREARRRRILRSKRV